MLPSRATERPVFMTRILRCCSSLWDDMGKAPMINPTLDGRIDKTRYQRNSLQCAPCTPAGSCSRHSSPTLSVRSVAMTTNRRGGETDPDCQRANAHTYMAWKKGLYYPTPITDPAPSFGPRDRGLWAANGWGMPSLDHRRSEPSCRVRPGSFASAGRISFAEPQSKTSSRHCDSLRLVNGDRLARRRLSMQSGKNEGQTKKALYEEAS
ncbi:hypothetical protein XA68_17195 [Ophiocordyceps unilateralis]|uniref:Uncharacterized protein n=1 Tax=Ophiocordyceps unilateralis TaxID=268505 RepID=A0A2A9P570_OPHUN|nr:hypothetical protein XA68_17195 [Ophiocordyceps unilateralis]